MPKKSEFIKLMEKGEVDDSYNIRGDKVASSRSSSRVKKNNIVKKGEQHQQEFLNFLINSLGDIKDVSISIDGSKRIPIKDLKKKIN